MRRAVPTTSIAIAFHVVMAVMILTARAPKKDAPAISKGDDLVEVGAAEQHAQMESGDTIVPAPGGGAMLVAPRGNVGSVVRSAPHVAAEPARAPSTDTIAAPPSVDVPTAPTVAVMPPRSIGLESSRSPLFLPKQAEKKAIPELRANPSVERLVTSTIEDATRGASAVNGRAVFVVKAETKEGDCSVVSVDLVDRQGSGWDEARRAAYERLRGKKLTVPAGTKVALLSIEVTSGVTLPVDEPAARRGENDMPELVLPELTSPEHRIVATRLMKTTYL